MSQNKIDNPFSENPSPYDINTADIWENERNCVFSENCNDKVALKLISNLEKIMELKGMCNIHTEKYENGDDSFKDYYSKKMKLYLESVMDFKELYRIQFFFDQSGNCYSHHTPIIITRSDSNFEYWFTFYLRQYDQNLFEIENFLEYQLECNFNQNNDYFIKFLILCLRQYNEILSENVKQTTQDWIDSKLNINKIKTRKNNKDDQSNFVPKKSFKLKDVDDFKEYFANKVNDFSELIVELREHFVHKTTRIQQLKDILSGVEIDPKYRIDWTGSFKELNMFVSLLNYDLKKIQPIKNGIWEVTCTCFIKNGKQIEESQLTKANGSDYRKNKLIDIINKL